MSNYLAPQYVDSPKSSLSKVRPVYDGGEWEIAVALVNWDGVESVGVRWNGGIADGRRTPGSPQSRGLPTWFILPKAFNIAILKVLLENDLVGGGMIDKDVAEKTIKDAIEMSAYFANHNLRD